MAAKSEKLPAEQRTKFGLVVNSKNFLGV